MKVNPAELWAYVVGLLIQAATVLFLVTVIGHLVRQFGFSPLTAKWIDPTPLAYLAGAYWLFRKAG